MGKVVLEAQPGAGDGYVLTMLWQMGWYAAGLVMWCVGWDTQTHGGKAGCWMGVALALFAAIAVMSSSPK